MNGYTIDERYVTNQKIINIIKNLISEKSYTAVYYVPSSYIINQIIIRYGENESAIHHHLDYFSFTYFEDKLYDLNRITLNDEFSHECYLKINLKKLWKERYQFEKGEYIDDTIKSKLNKALKIEFGDSAQSILNYMLQKYEACITWNESIAEQIQIERYMINTYKTDETSLEFYFEKLSS